MDGELSNSTDSPTGLSEIIMDSMSIIIYQTWTFNWMTEYFPILPMRLLAYI